MNKETQKIMAELDTEKSDELELEELRRDKSLKENLKAELETLVSLFPELKAEDIPDEVFESCDNGRGLAGQYAIYYLRNQREKEEIANSNEKNSKSAPPQVHNDSEEVYFTPDMVKSMSDKEIRRNYKAIMKSMEKWENK